MSVNILVGTRVDKSNSFVRRNPTLSAGEIAINEEGSIGNISGVKIGDGIKTWEELDYINVSPEVVDKWLKITKDTSDSKLVTLPDMNFAYTIYSTDNNAELENLLDSLLKKNIYFTINDKDNNSSERVGDLSIITNGYLTLFYDVDNTETKIIEQIESLTLSDKNSGTRTYKIYDSQSRKEISTLSNLFDSFKTTTNSNITKLTNQLASVESGASLPIFGTNSFGLVPSNSSIPANSRATHFLNANGDWVQISLYASGIELSQTDSRKVADCISDLYTAIDKIGTNPTLSITKVGSVSTKYYITGVENASSTTLSYVDGVYFQQGVMYGAAYNNDYAEARITPSIAPGRTVVENGDDTLSLANERLLLGGNIVSDTYGMLIGQTDVAKTPIALCGRVLAYPNEELDEYYPGAPVCTGPNGTVSIMSKDEVLHYPECIIGYVSAIPTYEKWNGVKVNGRIWIKVV